LEGVQSSRLLKPVLIEKNCNSVTRNEYYVLKMYMTSIIRNLSNTVNMESHPHTQNTYKRKRREKKRKEKQKIFIKLLI